MFCSSFPPIRAAREHSATHALFGSIGVRSDESRLKPMLWPLLLVGLLIVGGCAGSSHTAREVDDIEVKMAAEEGPPDAQTTRVQWTANGHTMELTMQGDVTVAGSFEDVQSIVPNGRFELMDTNGHTRRLRVVPVEGTPAEDSLSYRYSVDGQSQSFGKEGRRWLQRALHEVARNTGIGVEQRVAYLFEKGGADAVFGEARRVESEHGARFYYSAFVRLDAVSMTTANRALRRVLQRLDSDYQTRLFLEEAADRYAGASAHFNAYVEAVRTIDSDYQKRHLLTSLPTSALSGVHADTLFPLLSTIDSDYQKRHALADLLARENLPADFLGSLLKQVERIDSDYQKRHLLTSLPPAILSSDRADTVSHLLGRMDSDYQKRHAFVDLLARDDLPANRLVALLEQVQQMELGEDKAELLRGVEHLRTHDNPAVRKAYRKAVMSIVVSEDT